MLTSEAKERMSEYLQNLMKSIRSGHSEYHKLTRRVGRWQLHQKAPPTGCCQNSSYRGKYGTTWPKNEQLYLKPNREAHFLKFLNQANSQQELTNKVMEDCVTSVIHRNGVLPIDYPKFCSILKRMLPET